MTPTTAPTPDVRRTEGLADARSIAHRIGKGTSANLLRQAVNVLGQFAVLPVLLKYWGMQVYGEWQVLSAAVTYLALLNFGMQTYAVNRMNQHYSRGELREFTATLHSALFFSLALAGAAAMVAVPVAFLLPAGSWFRLEATSNGAARGILAILAVQMAIALPVGVIGGVYRAVLEYSREMTIASAYAALLLVSTGLIAVLGGGPLALATVQAGGMALLVGFMWLDLRRRHPEVGLGLKDWQPRLAWSLLAPSSLFFVIQISTLLALQGSTVLIGSTLGAASVAVFVGLRTLVNLIPQAIGSVTGALWPELTSLQARGELNRLRAAHLLAAKLALSFACAGAVYLSFAGADIVHVWTRGRLSYDPALAASLLILQVVTASYVSSALVLSSSNRHRIVAVGYLCSSAAGLALGAFLVSGHGAAGMAAGLALADAAICAWVIPKSACRLLGQSWSRFTADVAIRAGCVGAVLYAVVHAASTGLAGWEAASRLPVLAALTGVTGLGLVWMVALDRAERARLRPFASRALRLRATEGGA